MKTPSPRLLVTLLGAIVAQLMACSPVPQGPVITPPWGSNVETKGGQGRGGSDEVISTPLNEEPVISPDRQFLLFVSNAAQGSPDIWIANSDGSNPRPLTPWPQSVEESPDWSPDGRRIAFASTRETNGFNIWTIGADGLGALRLTSPPGSNVHPRYSPDGTLIAFASDRTGKSELWIMQSDGSSQRRLTRAPGQVNDPSWSPDGKELVFVVCTQRCNLFKIKADGSGLAQLTSGDFQDWHPDWGPNGVVFSTDRPGTDHRIWLLNPATNAVGPVSTGDSSDDYHPRWVTGSDLIAFDRSGGASDAVANIWLMSQNGSIIGQLTHLDTFGDTFGDTVPPSTTASIVPAPNGNGWNNTNVSVTMTATDNPGGSGIKEIRFSLSGAQGGSGVAGGSSASVSISAEGSTTLTYFAIDNAGNQEAVKTLTARIDKTPPTLAFGAPSPPANAAGWNNTNVAISFTTADNLSGVATTTLPSPVMLTTEGTGITRTVTVTDVAGNSATFASPAVNIDKTPPTIACVRVPRQKHENDESHRRLLFQVSASDNLSQSTITLGAFQLINGEIIQIQPTKRPGVQLVRKTDDHDGDDPGFRRFRVGPGADAIEATDAAGNVGTAACPLPPRRDDDDDGKGDDRGKGRERVRSDS